MSTLHCVLENGAVVYVIERQKMRQYRARSTEERRIRSRRKECQIAIFYFEHCVHKLRNYSVVLHAFDWKSAIE